MFIYIPRKKEEKSEWVNSSLLLHFHFRLMEADRPRGVRHGGDADSECAPFEVGRVSEHLQRG